MPELSPSQTIFFGGKHLNVFFSLKMIEDVSNLETYISTQSFFRRPFSWKKVSEETRGLLMPYTKSIVSAVMSALVMVQAPSFFDDSGGWRGLGANVEHLKKLEILTEFPVGQA